MFPVSRRHYESVAQYRSKSALVRLTPLVTTLTPIHFDAVPFGPFLALAGVEALFFGKEIISRVSAVFDQLAVLL